MGKRVVSYPTIRTLQALKKLDVQENWVLSSGGKILDTSLVSGCAWRIVDKDWYPDTSDLHVKFDIKIRNPIKLFAGINQNEGCEVSNRKSTIGVAVRWMLPKTCLQGAYHCADITFSNSGEMSFSGALDFPAATIRYRLTLEVVLYLKHTEIQQNEIFAKTPGALLATIACFTLLTGGSGGYFPIEVVEDGNEPLWRVSCQINCDQDFAEDFESDVFCLILNRVHPLYDQLGLSSRNGKLLLTPLMFEIFADACYVLFSRACQYLSDVDWELTKAEKEEQTVLVNFKALKCSCMPEFDRKQILDMQPEVLLQKIRDGLAKKINIGLPGEMEE